MGSQRSVTLEQLTVLFRSKYNQPFISVDSASILVESKDAEPAGANGWLYYVPFYVGIWVLADFGIHDGPGTGPLWIPRDD